MTGLPFRSDLVEWLADHRLPLLTPILQFFTFLGEIEGFILVVVFIYVAYDKRLAIRLAVLTLLVMSLNHLLKTLIQNPRPFIGDGSYRTRWAVSEARAADLATEYSTPSGHAMAGAGFYTYAYAMARSRTVRMVCLVCVLLTGLSRPYLGVHYLEDVLSGWIVGLTVALLALRYGDWIAQGWNRIAYRHRVVLLPATSLALWIVTWALSDWRTDDPPSAFVSYAGLLTGILVAQPLEKRLVDFDPKTPGLGRILLRYGMCVGLVLGTLVALDPAFGAIAPDASPLGHALRYLRYAAAAIAGLLLAPVLFVRLGLAEAGAAPEGSARRRLPS